LTSDSSNLQHFRALLNDNPKDVDALYGLAVIQDRLGMTRESLDTFRQALTLAPNDIDLLRGMGITFFKLGLFTDAESSLSRALVHDKDDLDTLLYMGRTCEALGDLPRAIDMYKRLQEKRPDDVEMLYNLAMAYGKANEPGESHYYFALHFKKKGRADSALFHFKAAARYFPSNSVRGKEIAREIGTPKR
jgi:tetratricopeptide (TPR) repeat protein